MKTYDGTIDWPIIEEYFALFEFNDLFGELKSKYGEIK